MARIPSLLPPLLAACFLFARAEPRLRAGAAVADITPTGFPVRVNGMFTERTADRAADRLETCALALELDATRLVIAVVDTCMVPRDVVDEAKRVASRACGVPVDRMLVSATHTHSAPSAMGCLGSRMDPAYTAWLPARIAEAITNAVARLEPAEAGWAALDDWDHTFNRRWIRRPDRMLTDPFGVANVRANMHPGHNSPDVTGPSGPVDPAFTVLSIRTAAGRPLAVLANYSMHYIGSPLLSADYFGRFRHHLARALDAGPDFVSLMSQGTSGDLASMDYGSAKPSGLGHDAYAQVMVTNAVSLLRGLAHHPSPPLAMAEARLDLAFRQASPERLAWARGMREKLGDRLPKSHPEIYALEALHLEARPRAELVLQALRVGDLALTALPNEVYALTGLKLKARSPLPLTMNLSLANGAEGYIPPPEQHKLGGYTTWAARTAGLEEGAEPRIAETLVTLLEKVSGKPRREMIPAPGPAVTAALALKPWAYWRLDEPESGTLADATGQGRIATLEDGIALYLPGAGSGQGFGAARKLTPSPFAANGAINRGVHAAGGRLRTTALKGGGDYTVSLWFWSGLPNTARPVTGYLASLGVDGDKEHGDHWGVGGSYRAGWEGRLLAFNGNQRDEAVTGRTPVEPRTWNHAVFVRSGGRVRAWLNGRLDLDADLARTTPAGSALFLGGRADGFANWEGRLDEAAVWDRALEPADAEALFRASGQAVPVESPVPASEPPPLSVHNARMAWRVREGFSIELAACEPQVVDPVAFDWDGLGRLWVVEMRDYPLGMDGKNAPGGRVKRLEDRDGDGFFETATLFADKLNFPTGILTWRDGVLVTAAPDILFLRDANDDGVMDERRVLFSGFSQGNQQLRVNGLRWGLDNWVYCASGGHHGGHAKDTRVVSNLTGKQIFLGPKDCRLRPDTGEIEPVEGPTQFGRNRDAWGEWFGSQNSWPLWHYVLPDAALAANPHLAAPPGIQRLLAPANPPVYPASAAETRYHSFEHASRYTSACSGMIYNDDSLFPDGDETVRHAFVCEPFHNLVQHIVLKESGSTFTANVDTPPGGADFLASSDRWCRPVMARAGPDGALWVADMYRLVIEHPDWLPAAARQDLMPRYRMGDDRGRIWRVVRADQPRRNLPKVDPRNPVDYAALFSSPSGWVRDRAQMRAIWEGPNAPALPDADLRAGLRESLRHASQPHEAFAALHRLAVLDARGRLTDDLLIEALECGNPRLAAHALRLASGRAGADVVEAACGAGPRQHPRAQLAFALAAARWPQPRISEGLVMVAGAENSDAFLRSAIVSALPSHSGAFVEALSNAPSGPLLAYAEPVLVTALGMGQGGTVGRLISSLLDGARTAEQLDTCGRLLDALDAAKPKDGLAAQVAEWTGKFYERLGPALHPSDRPDGTDQDSRIAALRLLLRSAPHREAAAQGLLAVANVQAVRALASRADTRADERLLEAWPRLSLEARAGAVDALLGRTEWTISLLSALDAGRVGRDALDPTQRLRLSQHADAKVRDRAQALFAAAAAREAVVSAFRPALALKGDAEKGRLLFAQRCAACHRVGEVGGDLGPNLQSVRGQPPERVLTSILDPNAVIEPGFAAYQATLRSGELLFGLLASETGDTLHFRLPGAPDRAVRRAELVSSKSTGRSLMPDGLEQGMDAAAMADLLSFLLLAP